MGIGWDLKHFLSVMPTARYGNRDHRRAVTVPAPSNAKIGARLRDLFTPGTFANLKTVTDNTRQVARQSIDFTSNGSNRPKPSIQSLDIWAISLS